MARQPITKFQKYVRALTEALKAQKTPVAFAFLKDYSSAKSNYTELQDVLINIGCSYPIAQKNDIEKLEQTNVQSIEDAKGNDKGLLEDARVILIEALKNPDTKKSQAQKDALVFLGTTGIAVCPNTENILICGTKVKKTVTKEGEYKADTRRPLTKAKDFFRHTNSQLFQLYKR